MKTLILVRHAKSSWEVASKDFDRPLQSRGIQDAHLVSSGLEELLPRTFTIFSSPAKRAMETALIFAQNLSCPIESIVFKEELYTFELARLEQEVRELSDNYDNVMLFGHNEAITDFVNKFGDIFVENVSTCGMVTLTFEASRWSDISKGRTGHVVFPRDLKHDHKPL